MLVNCSYLLRGYEGRAEIAGLGLLVSAPPVGIDSMSYRIMWNTPYILLRLMWCGPSLSIVMYAVVFCDHVTEDSSTGSP